MIKMNNWPKMLLYLKMFLKTIFDLGIYDPKTKITHYPTILRIILHFHISLGWIKLAKKQNQNYFQQFLRD